MTSPHLINGSFGSDDRAAAERILALCKDKTIRVMGPLDYSAGWNQSPSKTDAIKSEKKKLRDDLAILADKCVSQKAGMAPKKSLPSENKS